MKTETVSILGRQMQCYLPSVPDRAPCYENRPALLIFPGGAYAFTFVGEGEPIALRFASEGVACFVLSYTCTDSAPKAYPNALQEAFAAIRYIRDHAKEFRIDPNNLTVCGFSAGGHLAACTGTLWNKPESERFFPASEQRLYRPDKLLLCYPVIRGKAPGHMGSYQNFFGMETVPDDLLEAYSLQNRVDADTPPTFLWATAEDSCVPALGGLQFITKLAENGVPFETHIWKNGDHGLCLGNHVTQPLPFGHDLPVADWIDQAKRFLYT